MEDKGVTYFINLDQHGTLLKQKEPMGYFEHKPTHSSISVYEKIGWFKRLMIDWCFGLKYYEYGKENWICTPCTLTEKDARAIPSFIDKRYDRSDAFKQITDKMHETYKTKNADYGSSFDKSMDEFGITAAVVRMSDKMERLKSLTKKKAQVKDESVQDTLLDLANYAIMTVMYLKKHEDEKK